MYWKDEMKAKEEELKKIGTPRFIPYVLSRDEAVSEILRRHNEKCPDWEWDEEQASRVLDLFTSGFDAGCEESMLNRQFDLKSKRMQAYVWSVPSNEERGTGIYNVVTVEAFSVDEDGEPEYWVTLGYVIDGN